MLRWVSCSKTNKDIGDILQFSPRTVNKHQEHIYIKLGVETRTAATSVALAAITERVIEALNKPISQSRVSISNFHPLAVAQSLSMTNHPPDNKRAPI